MDDMRHGSAFFFPFSLSLALLACGRPAATGTDDQAAVPEDLAVAGRDLTGAPPLLITEVGTAFYTDSLVGSAWIELTNISFGPLELGDFELRTTAIDVPDKSRAIGEATFIFPPSTIAPGKTVVVRGWPYNDQYSGGGLVYLNKYPTVPFWTTDGHIELLRAGVTVDFVRFGGDATEPATSGQWSGVSATALPFSQAALGGSLTRDRALSDTDTAADWTLRAFATPNAVNDVECDTDADSDGIPDCSEAAGKTFAGLPLYDWGARPGQTDLFMEIDWMNPRGKGTFDWGLLPRREALEKVVSVFAAHGYTVHFDVGDLFDNTTGINPANMDLGGGNEVPFTCMLTFAGGTLPAETTNVWSVKNANHDPARRAIFYYALFGNVQAVNGIDTTTCRTRRDSSGRAELPGNDLIVTLGNFFVANPKPNFVIAYQAGTLMHEWGHNLNLRHGGDVDTNFKPNYLSVMNYLYQLWGLPKVGDPTEGDRYYLKHEKCTSFGGLTDAFYLMDGPYSPIANVRIDYSSGQSGDLTEDSLDESRGLRGNGNIAIDWNMDGMIGSNVASDINANFTAACPMTPVGSETHRDHDDWSSLQVLGRRTIRGDASGATLYQLDDQQPLADEPALHHLDALR